MNASTIVLLVVLGGGSADVDDDGWLSLTPSLGKLLVSSFLVSHSNTLWGIMVFKCC